MFRAVLVEKGEDGAAVARLADLDETALPPGEVTVAVEYSTVNYKDGLCLSASGGGLVRTWPHVPGIDFAGVVEASDDPRWRPGDRVILTGWRVGEAQWGGYAQKARVRADWLVAVPQGLTTRTAMAVGTAGFTAMQALMALEDHGLTPDQGEVLVTGAAGGVGSVAVALMARLGYQVAAVTGRPETADYLRHLGAARIVPRDDLAETVKKPLEAETWAGCIDAVGGTMLARLLGQMKSGASVAAVGNAGGLTVPANIIPFLLRGVNLLGINSVTVPQARRVAIWDRIARDLDLGLLEGMIRPARLDEVPALGAAILKGAVQGRVVVDVNA
ncbi:MDR family oxidoreductase [Pseudogemmobacter blasticus]|uniref:Oxidoreductase n=1 Tax=Fuscovulum blasticum DSM 2131 TaxID=1188250 RepID=A0A2T4JDN0_FUSBL|nr:MDR family oxidoreductase [Fuscovulum blasticum]PTE15981.1 oxidoreductase [Fuscovulum blasticum DSM 2131]